MSYTKRLKKSSKFDGSNSIDKKNIIKKLIKPETINLINWAKEMKVLNSLIKKFPDKTFWNSINPSFKLNSLCWLLSDKGRSFLNIEYKKYKLDQSVFLKNNQYKLNDNNIDSFENSGNLVLDIKPQTLKNFLNLWPKMNH